MPKFDGVPVSVLLPKATKAALRAAAKKDGDMPVSILIRRILQQWVDFNTKNHGDLTKADPK